MPAAWVAAAAAVYSASQSGDSSSGGGGSQQTANSAADTAAQVGKEQWQYYKDNYQPLETKLIGQADAAGSPDEYARARGAANADVTGAFDSSRKQTQSRLESYGINPGSPAYQSALGSTDLAEGATKTGALTAADNNTRSLAYSKALDVVGLGRNIPAQSSASAANAANAATNAGKLAFQRNQANAQSTGYAIGQVGNAASKWFNQPSNNQAPAYNNQTSSSGGFYDSGNYGNAPTDTGTVVPYAKGGKVSRYGLGYADGGEVGEVDMADKEGYRSKKLPDPQEHTTVRFSGPSRPRVSFPTGDRDSKLELSADFGVSREGIKLKQGGIVYRKTFADGGAVIDAEKTGGDSYDATALKGVLQKRGLNPAVAHSQAHGAASRHKGAITPHMRHFAGGGGVGRKGLEGPDASNIGEIAGPGTGTSDSVPAEIDGQQPAALSTGEFVMPAEVPKMTGEEILTAIKNAALKKRQQAGLQPQAANDAPAEAGAPQPAYASGGRVSRHGYGLGA